MVRLEQIAEAALAGDSLQTRSLTQDLMREQKDMGALPQPRVTDARTLALSAGLAELFANRLNQAAPVWTKNIGAADEPIFLVKSASTMRRLRELCQTESPLPLRKRNFFAPPNYLEFA